MGIFIYAFTATGKSTLARRYSNVIDMESTLYKYLDSKGENELLKGTTRKINPSWPNNYFKALEDVKDKYDYILISDEICNSFLAERHYEYWWVYPARNLKQEYFRRCKERGNTDEFINLYDKNWDEWIDSCENDSLASKHIELKSNQYLQDVLPNLKV